MRFEANSGVTLRLVGPLRLLRSDGSDVTPRTLKAQGILALLGTAPSLRRSRAWLQDKLWSDRTAEKGSASLRQTVHRLREAVGPDDGWLISDPGWIGLDAARVRVVLEPEAADWEANGDPPEFCEGIDIDDPEFEDWIRDQRFAFEDRLDERGPPPKPPAPVYVRAIAPPARTTLLVAPVRAEDSVVGVLAEILSTEVAMAVGRLGGAEVLLEEHAEGDAPADATRLEVSVCRNGDAALVQARLSEDGRLLWSNNRKVPVGAITGGAGKAIEVLIAEVTAAAAFHIGRGGTGAGRSQIRDGYRALENLFAVDHASLAECEQIFAATTEGPAVNIHRAWRAQIRVISVIERLATDRVGTSREAVALITQALREEPRSPIINAIAADVALHIESRPLKAAELAQSAIRWDPYSPYARASAAQAYARLGNASQAHLEALRALRLAGALPNQSRWLMRCCVTAVRCGRFREAARFAACAQELSPQFKPPLRFLAALLFRERDVAGATEVLRRLKALEPDFSLDLMGGDDYPVASLRDTPLIDVARSGLL